MCMKFNQSRSLLPRPVQPAKLAALVLSKRNLASRNEIGIWPFVYSYFEKAWRKKSTRQSRKALWKNRGLGYLGHGLLDTSYLATELKPAGYLFLINIQSYLLFLV